MLGKKDIRKECCEDFKNRVVNTKTPTYRETICKLCGHIIYTHEVDIKENKYYKEDISS